jgi:hypothetical protein
MKQPHRSQLLELVIATSRALWIIFFICISFKFHKYSLDSKSSERCIKILILKHLYGNYLGLYWHLANSGVRAHQRFLVYRRYTVVWQQYLICAPERFAWALPMLFSCKFDRSPYISCRGFRISSSRNLWNHFQGPFPLNWWQRYLLSRRVALSSHSPFCKNHSL